MNIHPTYAYPNGLDEGPPRPAGRWRGLGRVALGLVAAVAVVVLAWMASNWRDAAVQPRPAELALPAAQVPATRNIYFALLGLQAAADRDPAKAAQALWQSQMELAQTLQNAADPAAREATLLARVAEERQILGSPLASLPAGEPWDCDELATDCVALWLDKAEAGAQQRQALQLLGTRCDATVDALQPGQSGAFEEVLPTHWHVATQPMGLMSATVLCSRWQHSAAVLAFRQGRKEEAWRLLARSNHWHRVLLAGSHTLVTRHFMHSVLRRHLAVVTGLVAQDPAWAAQAVPLLAPFGAPQAGVRRWMVAEAALQHATLKSISSDDLSPASVSAAGAGTNGWAETAKAVVTAPLDWLHRHHIGWHPERTAQAQDQQWGQRIKQLDAGLPAAVAAARGGPTEADSSLFRWWLNPAGRLIVEVTRSAYDGYLRRPLDLDLHRETALLGLNALRLGIAPKARAAWAQQQPASPALRERLAWSADGRSLSVRPWAADGLINGQDAQPNERIVITLERAPPA